MFLDSLSADAYLCSANAVTMRGELYNVDGNGNRVAALCYGPASVIVVAGRNKLVSDLDEAVSRVKRMAAPANALRLEGDVLCPDRALSRSRLAVLHRRLYGTGPDLQHLCRAWWQQEKSRIKVILVEEDLGL